MICNDPPSANDALGIRLVLALVGGFWLFFLGLMTARSLLLNPLEIQPRLLAIRLLIAGTSAALNLVLWLGLRRLDRRSLRRRVLAAAIGCGLAALLFAILNAAVYLGGTPCHALGALTGGAQPMMIEPVCNEHWRQLLAEHLVTGYFLMATWSALYLALSYAAQVGTWERRAATLRAAAQAAELRALRYQVNPHFLFNTLNALSSLVLADRRDAAETMIGDLATYYRASLAFAPERDVTLAEEVEMQRLYLSIEAKRFPDRLAVIVDLPADLADARVPGMVLQPLVENAVKHGVARSRGLVTVRITAQAIGAGNRLVVVVEDDAAPQGAAMSVAGTGTGLRNVVDRLTARYGNAASVRWKDRYGGYAVVLDLPLVRDAN